VRLLRAASIRKQILLLAILLVVLVSLVAMISEPFIYGRHDKGIEIGLFAGRAELIVSQFERAQSIADEDAILQIAASDGLSVQRLSSREVAGRGGIVEASDDLLATTRAAIDPGFLHSIVDLVTGRPAPSLLIVRVDADRALAIDLPDFPKYLWLAPAVASGLLKIIIPLAILAYFSSWLITRPLERIAEAAKRESVLDETWAEPFEVEGASEIRSLANSLNLMRARIQHMAVDRTRVLRAVSHDLRTPLTRLRMRAERCEQADLKDLMLRDIATLGAMIDESLAFLNNTPEEARKVDLSSLLQTVSSDFSDTGNNVVFDGPRRLVFVCKPQGITRAISNLVSNSSRYAKQIAIGLEATDAGGVKITVKDDGPGLSDELKKRVIEPFFKADEARQIGAAGGGFGLGLPITKGVVEKGHNGTFTLLDNKPTGLMVEIELPPPRGNGTGSNRRNRISIG
jgi:signal transduction histidine kinase